MVGWMSGRARARATVALIGLGVLLGTAPASAEDVYTVHTCRGPDGEPASVAGWSFSGASVARRSDCLTGGDLAGGPTLIPYGQSQPFAWQFEAPADTRIVGYTLYRTVVIPKGDPWAWNWNLFRNEVFIFDDEHLAEKCWAPSTPCRGLGDDNVSEASRFEEAGVDLYRLIANVDCYPATCPPNSGVSLKIHRADFTLRDNSDPAFVGTPSGDLLDTTKPLAGVRGVSFAATDKGGGVHQAMLEIDGQPVLSEVVDANGGRCSKPFLAPVPCRANASGTLSFDTSSLPDGQHSVRLIVSDPTDTNTAAFGPVQITTINRAPECDPAVRSNATPVEVAFRGTRRRQVTRRSGRATVTGRVGGVGGGMVVYLLSREQRSGAPAMVGATAVTVEDGSFTLPVPSGASRRLRAAYRVRDTDPLLVCSRPLNVRVPARATLRVSPRRVRPGGRVRLSGRLRSGRVPRRGKLVSFEARSGGRWRVFDTVRSDRNGRFRTSYRFNRRSRAATYPIRVRVPVDASYPFALGYSPAVRVRVR